MRAFRLTLAALLPLACSGLAAAQGIVRPPPQATPQAAPAPALPGLAARPAPAPIAGDAGANLSPNAALFDAINRGDLAAARDAVARGANLNARNQLGLTPIDAAVDQGRNEIAFYLLSARDISRAPPPELDAASLDRPPATPVPAPRSRARQDITAPAAPLPASPATARLWAGDGGTPRPEIGFLGFDAGRPPGAEPPPTRRGTRG